jgi:hypothetical protein
MISAAPVPLRTGPGQPSPDARRPGPPASPIDYGGPLLPADLDPTLRPLQRPAGKPTPPRRPAGGPLPPSMLPAPKPPPGPPEPPPDDRRHIGRVPPPEPAERKPNPGPFPFPKHPPPRSRYRGPPYRRGTRGARGPSGALGWRFARPFADEGKRVPPGFDRPEARMARAVGRTPGIR